MSESDFTREVGHVEGTPVDRVPGRPVARVEGREVSGLSGGRRDYGRERSEFRRASRSGDR